MRTGSSDFLSLGRRGRMGQKAQHRRNRKSRDYRIDLEGLEARTLLATTPAVTATGVPVALNPFGIQQPFDGQQTNFPFGNVTTSGNANSPAVAIDPYDPSKLFAVWGVDLSTLTPPLPITTAIVEGAFSSDGGTTWHGMGEIVFPLTDAATIDSSPPTPYTQVTDPNVSFDASGNVYVLTLQNTGAADGALVLDKWNFSGGSPVQVDYPDNNSGIFTDGQSVVYRWLSTSDAANTPTLAVDAGLLNPPAGVAADPFANNVYVAWASTDIHPANPNVLLPFNPNRAELVVSTDGGTTFSGETILNVTPANGNIGGAANGLQDDSHPALAINQNANGLITAAWEDFGSGATASPKFTDLMSTDVQAGNSFGESNFTGGTIMGAGAQADGNWGTAAVYDAGPTPGALTDPVSIAVGDVNSANGNDIIVADEGTGQVGELLNSGTGTFPASATVFNAGNGPSGVVLGDLTNHTSSATLDAGVSNLPGGASVLVNDGTGNYSTLKPLSFPPQALSAGIAEGNLDGTGLSLVEVNEGSNSITIFPDATTSGAFSLSAGLSSPIAVIVAQFRGTGTNPDIAVLNSNGTVQFYINNGDLSFSTGPSINVGTGAVAMATATLATGGLPGLAVANDVGGNGFVEVLPNNSPVNGGTINFGGITTLNPVTPLPGVPVGLATGNLSGVSAGLSDIAVAYQRASDNESMVAVFRNTGNLGFARVSPHPGSVPDYDAGQKFPTAIRSAIFPAKRLKISL